MQVIKDIASKGALVTVGVQPPASSELPGTYFVEVNGAHGLPEWKKQFPAVTADEIPLALEKTWASFTEAYREYVRSAGI